MQFNGERAFWAEGDKASQSSVAFIPGGSQMPATSKPRRRHQVHSQEPQNVPALLGAWALLPREGGRRGKWEFQLQTPCVTALAVTLQPWMLREIISAHG